MIILSRVMIFVRDVDICGDFYERAFGLKRVEDTYSVGEWLELDGGGCKIAFHKAYGPDGPVDSPTGSAQHPHKLVFYVPDVAAIRADLEDQGVTMDDIKQFGDQMLCDGSDPEGHRFQICNQP